MGRWSAEVAPLVIAWMGVPPGCAWIDAGCGTGALTRAMLDAGASSVVGVDRSDAYLDHARRRVADARARFVLGDLAQLPLPSHSVDAAGSGLVVNFLPDPAAGMAEMARVVRRGGTVGCYVWDYAGGMELLSAFWDAAAALDPAALRFDERPRFAGICGPRQLTTLFDDAGMRGVVVDDFEVVARFAGAGEAWRPFLGGQGPGPTYLGSLDTDARERVREEFVRRLDVAGDGSVSLLLRAFAARGRTQS
jgi:SAM-dependent methyltransferase